MRSLSLIVALALSGCAEAGSYGVGYGAGTREIELTHDDGKPAERPILPSGSYELLLKGEPNVPAYRLLRLRFLVAQPGRLQLQVYDTSPEGRPGRLLFRVERDYGAPWASNGTDGKWVVENIPALPPVKGPVWVGVGLPDGQSEARVWAAQNDSGHVFQRDVEPGTAIISAPVRYTPMVRLSIKPE